MNKCNALIYNEAPALLNTTWLVTNIIISFQAICLLFNGIKKLEQEMVHGNLVFIREEAKQARNTHLYTVSCETSLLPTH